VRILVTGATGNVGSALVGELRAADVAVRAVSRRPRVSASPHLEWAFGDLASLDTMLPLLAGVDAVFLLATGLERPLLNAARGHGVGRVVLLSTIASASRPDSQIGKDHRAAEEAVIDSGLAWTILRPTHFASNAREWAADIRSHGRARGLGPDTPLPVIDPADVAAVAARALTSPRWSGRVLHLTGPCAVSERERVAIICPLVGRDIPHVETAPSDLPVEMREIAHIRNNPLPLEQVVTSVVPDVTGRAARTFEQWCRANIDLFR
jgi:uncharacterized protein YbjT (DUF2867 family)